MEMPQTREDRSGKQIIAFRNRREKINNQVKLTPELHAALRNFSIAHNTSVSLVVAVALVNYFNNMEAVAAEVPNA